MVTDDPLPLRHLDRVNLVLAGNLPNRLHAEQSFQSDFRFEGTCVSFPFSFTHGSAVVSFSAELEKSNLASGPNYGVHFSLPETLPPDRRHPLHAGSLLRGYWKALSSARFVALVLALTLNFSAVFVYIVSAPAFLFNLLHRKETEFYWLFGPIAVGMLTGTWLAGRLAGHWSNVRTLALAYGIMALASTSNAVFHLFQSPALPWSVLPLAVYVPGSALAMPSLTLMALDLFPHRRGLASSCQGFVQTTGNAVVTAAIAPILWGTARRLSGGMLALFIASGAMFVLYVILQRVIVQSSGDHHAGKVV